jgi:hypothetical protein
MTETHIVIQITCDECGKCSEFEEYDHTSTDGAFDSAWRTAHSEGWDQDESCTRDLCPTCVQNEIESLKGNK